MIDFTNGTMTVKGVATSARIRCPNEELVVAANANGTTTISRNPASTTVLNRGVYHISMQGPCGCVGVDVHIACANLPSGVKPATSGSTKPASDGGTEPTPTC
jgi:hypothetical protein